MTICDFSRFWIADRERSTSPHIYFAPANTHDLLEQSKGPVTPGLRPCYDLVKTKNGGNHEQIVETSHD